MQCCNLATVSGMCAWSLACRWLRAPVALLPMFMSIAQLYEGDLNVNRVTHVGTNACFCVGCSLCSEVQNAFFQKVAVPYGNAQMIQKHLADGA